MSKTVLLATAAAFALVAGGASAAQRPSIGVFGAKIAPVIHLGKSKAKALYNQNSNVTGGIDSQNFTSGSFSPTYNSSGADDFVVPKKAEWTVTEVDASGVYFGGSGPATSENVIFYTNSKNMPGKAVKGGSFSDLKGTDNSGSFSISLGKKGVTLKSGTYWVAVVANCSYVGGCGEWGWAENTKIHGNPAMWENPGDGFGTCPTWGTFDQCIETSGGNFIANADFAFELLGKSKKSK
ncbi:MAG TPA: hypothetical protein VMF67_14760 [Rhizomicrobium sp.]|nr:hypothetical protein [Rhizomicrobium sp.]